MSILPRENGGGIFGQGMFSIDPNASPDQIARKREMIAALMPRFGQARYVGEGLGQLATGVAFGKMNRNLDKAEGAGRKSAAERFQQLLGGGTAQPGGFSILGPYTPPAPVDPSSPQGIADDTMAALGKGPVGHDFVVDGLVARGMPEHVAQGFAMNFADESAFNPQAVGDSGNAYGLAQWNGPRKRALFDFAERQGKNPADPNVQMDFLAHEVQGPESAAWGKIAATSDPRSAAAAVLNYFERPAETHRARREAAYLGGRAPSGGQGAPLEALYAAAADPWLDQGQRAIIMSMIQTRQQESDPLRQMQLQKGQLELEQMRNPPAPEELTTRRALAAEAGLQPGTPEYQTYMATGKLAGGADLPSGFATLDLQAKAAGYQPGTPEYQEFMRNGGGSGAPAAFIALDLQAKAAGFTPGTPEYQQFMATRGSGLAAQATAQGKAAGEATASAPTQIANGEIALQGIEEIRNHPSIDRGTGASSVFNRIPGTGGYAFESRVKQLAGGAFLTAIQQMQGMGALSNSEGQTATAALNRMDTALSREEFDDALADYEAIVKQGMARAQGRIDAAPAAPQGAPAARYNPATGKIEPVGGN